MPTPRKSPRAVPPRQELPPTAERVREALERLESQATAKVREEMGPRYGIHAAKAFGVPVGEIQKIAKGLGRDHALAAALWETGWYEARLLASFVDEPDAVSAEQMDGWARDFDNWGVCDTVCFHLFDRTPHAFAKVAEWAVSEDEFVKRAAFALLASLALHGKKMDDELFVRCLPLIEAAAQDDRNFVKKGVNWALRALGKRGPDLRAAAVAVAQRLAASSEAAPRWVGKDALRELSRKSL